MVLSKFHSSPVAGHSSSTKTYGQVKHSFFGDGMKLDIFTFVVKCDTCKCNGGKTGKPCGTLQLLPLPPTIWTDISMDFIVGLPKSGNTSVISHRVLSIPNFTNTFVLECDALKRGIEAILMQYGRTLAFTNK
jgi:hypothetical protein